MAPRHFVATSAGLTTVGNRPRAADAPAVHPFGSGCGHIEEETLLRIPRHSNLTQPRDCCSDMKRNGLRAETNPRTHVGSTHLVED
jgi:hypothetical protein